MVSKFLREIPDRFGRPVGNIAYNPQIDGLRGLAILIVVLWHESLRAARYVDHLNQIGRPTASLYNWFLHGEVGVDLFFFISGLVITQSILSKSGDFRYSIFLKRRLIRIYPPYVVSIIGCYIILGVIGHVPEGAKAFDGSSIPLGQSLLLSLAYLHSLIFDSASRLNPPMWSLEIEIQFYLIVPILVFSYAAIRRHQTKIIFLISLILSLMVLDGWLHHYFDFDNRYRAGILMYSPFFLIGILVAELERTPQKFDVIPTDYYSDLALLCGCCLISALGIWFNHSDAHPHGFLENCGGQLLGISAIILIYKGALYGKIGRQIFGGRWLVFIGTFCYSIYLTHVIVIQGISELFLQKLPLYNRWEIWSVWLFILNCLVLPSSLLFYIAIERPLMQGRLFPRHKRGAMRSRA